MNYYYNLPQDLQDKIYLYNVRQAKENLHAELLGVLKDYGNDALDDEDESNNWEDVENWEYDGVLESIHPEVCRNNVKWDYSKYATLILYHYDIWCETEERTRMYCQRGENGKGWVLQ